MPVQAPEKLFAEAEHLRLAYEKEASQQAIAKYRDALAGWERQGNKRDAARAAQRIGATYEQLGSLRESLRSYLEALSLAQELPTGCSRARSGAKSEWRQLSRG